jgi:hypothetical protein
MTEGKSLIASVSKLYVMVNNNLPISISDLFSIPWTEIALPLAAAEDAVARLDERLAKSPIREAWIARTHFSEACASLWIEGELVHIEDLVLHDAHMDIRMPTPELTRAHAILGLRRRVAESRPEWPLSNSGIASLLGRAVADDFESATSHQTSQTKDEGRGVTPGADVDLAEAFAAIDAAIDRVGKALARDRRPVKQPRRKPEPEAITYEADDDRDNLSEWRHLVASTGNLPPTLAAAIAADAWDRLLPAPQMPWLGRLLSAALLRDRGKAKWHLPCLYDGFKSIDTDVLDGLDKAAVSYQVVLTKGDSLKKGEIESRIAGIQAGLAKRSAASLLALALVDEASLQAALTQ